MEMKKSFTLGVVVLCLALVLNSVLLSAITGSMGNARMVLHPEVNGFTNTVIDRTILIKNVNDVPINITLQRNENATKFVTLIDESFILQPGEERKAAFQVKVKKEGTYEGKINVFFKPVDNSTKEPGVVLSSIVTVIAKKDQSSYDNTPDNTDNTDNTNVDPTTVDGNNSNSKVNPMTLLTISTAVLLVVLIFLFFIAGKKGSKKKGSKVNQKRRTHK
jgi:hypothetical protein